MKLDELLNEDNAPDYMKQQPPSLSSLVLEVLKIAGQPLTSRQVALGIFNLHQEERKLTHISTALCDLKTSGAVSKLKRGLYLINDEQLD